MYLVCRYHLANAFISFSLLIKAPRTGYFQQERRFPCVVWKGVPGLPGAPHDEAGLTRKFETSHVGGATGRTPPIPRSARASGENPHGRRSSRKPRRRPRPRELRAFFSCMAWRAIPGPLSKRKRSLDSLEAAQGAPRDPRRDSRGERSPWLPLETRPDPRDSCPQ